VENVSQRIGASAACYTPLMTQKPTPPPASQDAKPSKPTAKVPPKGGAVGDNEALKREMKRIAFRNSQKRSQRGH
jgi:hypothetical protein